MKTTIKRRISDFLLAGFFSVMIWSCTWDVRTTPPVEVPDTVSYSLDIQPIWDESCNTTGCHDLNGFAPDLTEANSYNAIISGGYVEVGDPHQSSLYQVMAPGGSMERFSTEQDRALVFTWIEEGARNN